MEPPSELKHLKRFIREATRIEKASPVVAYYCRFYAVQAAMGLDDSKKTTQIRQWISNELSNLEKITKEDISKEKTQEIILSAANNSFDYADNIDRAGKADLQTVSAFNTAGVFYTILKQFGDLPDEVARRIEYCSFKTLDIFRAIKQGKKPQHGDRDGHNVENEALDTELNKISEDVNVKKNDSNIPQESSSTIPKHNVDEITDNISSPNGDNNKFNNNINTNTNININTNTNNINNTNDTNNINNINNSNSTDDNNYNNNNIRSPHHDYNNNNMSFDVVNTKIPFNQPSVSYKSINQTSFYERSNLKKN